MISDNLSESVFLESRCLGKKRKEDEEKKRRKKKRSTTPRFNATIQLNREGVKSHNR